MEVTADHPVYVEDEGWIWAENLEAGDELRTAEGDWATVVSVEHVQLNEPELVYNFTVKGPHTYFVLDMRVLVHNDSEGVCDPDAYPHLLNNLQTGGFSTEQSQEIVRRLYDAGVSNEQMRQIDEVFANAHIVEVSGEYDIREGFRLVPHTKNFQLMSISDETGENFLIWRFAGEDHPYYGLQSNFSRLTPQEQNYKLRWAERDALDAGRTAEEQYAFVTASPHAYGNTKECPWLSTGGHLAPIVRTTHTRLFEETVMQAETLFLLKVPTHRLSFEAIARTSEMEILVNAMRDPLNPYVVERLPNIFRDEPFARSLRAVNQGS